MRFNAGWSIYLLASAIGILALLRPFILDTGAVGSASAAHADDAPIVTGALVVVALLAQLVDAQGASLNAKVVATLGVLTAIVSTLRFVETAIPGPGGFSPVFAPVILAGYVFGGRFGFLLGSFTMLVSSLITGTVGPWLPFQMISLGWVGMTSGWIGHALQGRVGRRAQIWAIVGLGFVWGLLFGAIMNLYFWPFVVGPVDQTWAHGSDVGTALDRYAVFYVSTSLIWDLSRSIGNVALLLPLCGPTINVLKRFRQRFQFEV